MGQNISKYVALNPFLLLEYEFNRDLAVVDMTAMGGTVAMQKFANGTGCLQFYNTIKSAALGVTNNTLEMNSVPLDSLRTQWVNNYLDPTQITNVNFTADSSAVSDLNYPYDTVKVHIVSGYNFDDIAGFMLQVRAEATSGEMVDLSNFTYVKQPDALGSADVVKFSSNVLYLGNKFYDKYVEFKVPSIASLSGETASDLEAHLGIKSFSDVFMTYSTVATFQTDAYSNNTFVLADSVNVQLPVTSVADNFNAFIAESTEGDFIEYYGTWAGDIIGAYIGDIESGRIKLYNSNNPNDDYQSFDDTYGVGTRKWVLVHEIYVYEQLPGMSPASSTLTQKFAFTQEDNFNLPNYFRPVLKNADLDASYLIQYICRLSNRMDGTQIIRRATFASTDPKKYGLRFTRLNVDNIIPYKIFNKISEEKANVIEGNLMPKTKYVKVFYDITTVVMNQFNEVYPDGVGPLFLKSGDATYKMKFEKINNTNGQRLNVDLSGVFNYVLLFALDDGSKLEIVPTYSSNMNTLLGEIEFKITGDQTYKLLQQNNKKYSIMVKNPDTTSYVFYEGAYYDNTNFQSVMNSLSSSNTIGELNNKIAALEIQIKALTDENATLKST